MDGALNDSSMSFQQQTESNMITTIPNVNVSLDQVFCAIRAAKKSGLHMSAGTNENFFSCVSVSEGINKTIDLENVNANLQLQGFLNFLLALTPSYVAMGAH